MKIVCTMPARNEDWILGLSLRAVLGWADSVVILDHASTDRTPDIIAEVSAEHPGRVISLHEPDPCWAEMAHRQRLLEAARREGATHIAIVDADEVLTGNLIPRIRGEFERLMPGSVLQLPWLMCWRSRDQYRNGDASVWSQNWVSCGFVDAPHLHWRARDGYDFHHRHPMGRELSPARPVARVAGGILHLQHASWRRLMAKQCLYGLTELIRWPGRKSAREISQMYGGTVDETGIRYSSIPAAWWAPYAGLMQYLHVDAEPWQEAECRRLMAEHGREKFAGLNLFGVV